jgi:2,3-bisphosphoglycerate-dependent phosphoglycerate mutase
MEKINIYAKYLIPILVIGWISCYYLCCYLKSPVTTVILVRHADRAGSLDELNAAGVVRAQELERVLGEAKVSVIYTSTANRTKQTANPLATQLAISTATYDTNNLPALVNEIKSTHKGKVVLIVGHSNTVPQTINLMGVTPALTDIPSGEFDNLYIVTLSNRNITRLVKMKYGAHTP